MNIIKFAITLLSTRTTTQKQNIEACMKIMHTFKFAYVYYELLHQNITDFVTLTSGASERASKYIINFPCFVDKHRRTASSRSLREGVDDE